jgi:hypothetical protein
MPDPKIEYQGRLRARRAAHATLTQQNARVS